MSGEYDIGTPTQCVNVYEAGRLVAQVICESAQEAAEWPRNGSSGRESRARSTISG